MKPKSICVIAPLPPKSNVAARHAGAMIHHLHKAGFDVRPATTQGPAYCLDRLAFAPKARYLAEKERLSSPNPDHFIFYPEGLAFAQISQARLWHRWLEGLRRTGLVWRLLRNANQSLVVFRPKKLGNRDQFLFLAVAGLAKLLRPGRVAIRRQINSPEKLSALILGEAPEPVLPEDADLSSLALAVNHGADTEVQLSPIWLQAALNRLPGSHPLFNEITFLNQIVAHYGEPENPLLPEGSGFISAPPFADTPAPPLHGEPVSAFMMHIHAARRLGERFPLGSRPEVQAFKHWYYDRAPKIYHHALFRDSPEHISAELNPEGIATALKRILENARFFGAEQGVDPALRTWLSGKICNDLSRLELLVAVLAHAPLEELKEMQFPWQSKGVKRWYAQMAYSGFPALAQLAGLAPPPRRPQWETTGQSAKDTGLAQNQRMSERALHGLTAKRNFYLHHVNADSVPAKMLAHHSEGSTHIGYLLWELEALPKAHELAGSVLDEVWAPSRYVQNLYQPTYECPVTWVGKGFDLPAPTPFDLSRLGIRRDQPVFLLSFDLHSSVARKNPLAAVLAFQMAFEGQPEARLVIKTSPPPKNHWGDPEQQMSIIHKLMARDKRIILFQEHLPFAAYLGLIEAATALVSPHRAEGFGYVPAYALALGTPVIATDYSGTQDFCTPETALPVRWRQRSVRPGEPIYPLENAFWAEIDHEGLAEAMQEVLKNPLAAQERSRQGQMLMQQRYSEQALKQRYVQRLTEMGLI